MERRSAVKNISLSIGGLIALPSWAISWSPKTFSNLHFSSNYDKILLGEIAETFIPQTSTAGAKTLKIDQFIGRMIYDCYADDTQRLFEKGLISTENLAKKSFSKQFSQCSANERMDILNQISQSDEVGKKFVNLVKGLTIQAYTNSEYYMVNVLKYEMAPGFYHGCVPVS